MDVFLLAQVLGQERCLEVRVLGLNELDDPLARFIRNFVGWGVAIVPVRRNPACIAPSFQTTEERRAGYSEHLQGLLYGVDVLIVGR